MLAVDQSDEQRSPIDRQSQVAFQWHTHLALISLKTPSAYGAGDARAYTFIGNEVGLAASSVFEEDEGGEVRGR